MTNGLEMNGFDATIGAEVSEARERKKGNSFNELVSKEAKFKCPVCGAAFHGANDVPRHLEALGDPGLRVGDEVVNVGNNRMSGKIDLIDRGHSFVMIALASKSGAPAVVKKFQIVAGSGPFKGRPFWIKRAAS